MAICNTSITGHPQWEYWISRGTATTSTTTDYIWETWSNATSTTATTTSNDTWYVWSSDRDEYVVHREWGEWYNDKVYHKTLKPKHDAHVVEYQNEQRRIRMAEAARKRKEAQARARELLVNNLNAAQQADLDNFGFFFVDSKRPERKYRIRKGRVGNVDVMEGDKILHRLCAHPAPSVPDDDTRLAQKLMLEHMEDAFVARANVHPARH